MSKTNNSKIYKAAIYLRLSREDEQTVDGVSFKAESNSITNQRLLIQNYLKSVSDISQTTDYVDDGYSGSNFDRPSFKSMIEDVRAGKVNCVIVKDFSRFGREFIESGKYMSQEFPERGVRFISINDHYDSLTADLSESSLTMPIKNLINDSYSRDISVKVRTSKEMKRKNGEFIGSFTVYGFLKDPKNKNKLIVDETAGPVVKDIYTMKLSGLSANAIADRLNAAGILSPMEHKAALGISCVSGLKKNPKASWFSKSVLRILQDEIYTGTLVQGKSEKINYKVKKYRDIPKEEWIRCENCHEVIISKEDYDIVQELLQRDTRTVCKDREPYMFAGLLFCGDCGKSLVRRVTRTKEGDIVTYICSSYNRHHTCSRHSINEKDLEAIILDQLHRHIVKMVNAKELINRIESLKVNYEDAVRYDAEISNMKEEKSKIEKMIHLLSADLEDGLINQEQYTKYHDNFTEKINKLERAITTQEKMVQDIYENGAVVEQRFDKFKELHNIEKLDRMALVSFVDKVLIYEDKSIHISFKYEKELEKIKSIIALDALEAV